MVEYKGSISPLGDVALKAEFRLKDIHRQVLHNDLTKTFKKEITLTSKLHNPIPQNMELDVIGDRGSGKSLLLLDIIEKSKNDIGGLDFDINKNLFYTNQDLVNFLMSEMHHLSDIWLMKDEEHLEIGQDSFINRIKVERFADECRKRRINIGWCSVQKQLMINTDYTIRRIDFDRPKHMARSLLFDGNTGIPLGVIYTGLPSTKMVSDYEKFKDEHLKTLLVGERVLDYRDILRSVIEARNITPETKINKKEFKALVGLHYGDLSLNQLDSIISTFSLWRKGFIELSDLSQTEESALNPSGD